MCRVRRQRSQPEHAKSFPAVGNLLASLFTRKLEFLSQEEETELIIVHATPARLELVRDLRHVPFRNCHSTIPPGIADCSAHSHAGKAATKWAREAVTKVAGCLELRDGTAPPLGSAR